jgi:hypothetical protein
VAVAVAVLQEALAVPLAVVLDLETMEAVVSQ